MVDVPRRQFELPADDRDFLDGLGRQWETINEAGKMAVLVHDIGMPPGLLPRAASVAFLLHQQYPDVALDMAYFLPGLTREDGRPIMALAVEQIDGSGWQRWSRHRPKNAPWRPGIDGVETHYMYMQLWLEDEPRRN